MSKGTTIKEALSKWEHGNEGTKASETAEINLYCQLPPIEKMDASLSTLSACTNNIKSLTGLEAIGDTLEELWISYNLIEKLKGINVLKKLKILYISNNLIKDWTEFNKLGDLPMLEELLMVGNPLEEKHKEEGDWKDLVSAKLKKLKKLDGAPIIPADEDE